MSSPNFERRARAERRRSILRALWHGNFARRRLSPRRGDTRHAVVTDWFEAKWLIPVIGILVLCCADALLTLTLIARGAVEMNPFMAPLVVGSGHSFAYWKVGLTAMGVIVLTLLARIRVFGWVVVGSILYVILAGYLVLIGYELFLLRNITSD